MKVDKRIYVHECEHGSIHVDYYDNDEKIYLITAMPDEGYELKKENIFIAYEDGSANSVDITVLNENQFLFSTHTISVYSLIVNALFTKKTDDGETI